MHVLPGERAAEAAASDVPSWPRHSTEPPPRTHAGPLDGATVVGEAARRHLSVRVGVWLGDGARVRQARWRCGDDRALRTCAEVACVLLERGLGALAAEARTLGGEAGVTGLATDRAELVAAAVRAALLLRAP